jgi:ADP-ribosyl-[dinitrogen reductase] hydrolase
LFRRSRGSSGRWRISFSIDAVKTNAFKGALAFGPIPRSRAEVQAIADWGAGLMISLVPREDMARYAALDLPAWIADAGLPWLHLPIEDFQAPDAAFETAWHGQQSRVHAILNEGGKVFVHCAAGLGRSGTVVGRILLEAGVSLEDALAATRAARPGAVETAGQEAYLARVSEK